MKHLGPTDASVMPEYADLDAYDKLVSYQISNGVDGLIVGGTTGEGQLMSWDEHVMLIAHTAAYFGKEILVIGNTGQNNACQSNAIYHSMVFSQLPVAQDIVDLL